MTEIPRVQRQTQTRSLEYYVTKYGQRNDAIYAAFVSGGYRQKEIADYFNLHYSSISKIIKQYKKIKKEVV